MSIGKKITQLREEMGISQRELARKLGVHYQSIGRWEHDETIPDANDLRKIAEFFKVTMDYLFFDNVPKDGRIDIPDVDLLRMFEEVSTMDEQTVSLVKQFLDSFLFKKKILQDIEKRPHRAKR
jgi:transcriptional regulator with XRE-family HTH domain